MVEKQQIEKASLNSLAATLFAAGIVTLIDGLWEQNNYLVFGGILMAIIGFVIFFIREYLKKVPNELVENLTVNVGGAIHEKMDKAFVKREEISSPEMKEFLKGVIKEVIDEVVKKE